MSTNNATAIRRNEQALRPADSEEHQTRGEARFEPHFLILTVSLIAIPPITYYYYQYRDQHMREKKEAILKEIQARAAQRG